MKIKNIKLPSIIGQQIAIFIKSITSLETGAEAVIINLILPPKIALVLLKINKSYKKWVYLASECKFSSFDSIALSANNFLKPFNFNN